MEIGGTRWLRMEFDASVEGALFRQVHYMAPFQGGNVAITHVALSSAAVVLGSNVWPRTGPGPFLTGLPADWEALAGHLGCAGVRACRQAYAWYLMRNQWTMDDVRDPARVEQLLGMAGPVPADSAPAEGSVPSGTHVRLAGSGIPG